MKKFLAALLVVVVLFTVTVPKTSAKAEGLTIAMIAGGAYAIASAAGIDFSFTGFDGLGVNQWMQNRINSWLGGHTLAEKFGGEVMRLTAGKLLIPSAAVAGIVNFLSDLKTDLGLSENSSTSTPVIAADLNGKNVYPYSSTVNPGYPLYAYETGGTPSWGIVSKTPNTYGYTTVIGAYGINGNQLNGENRTFTDGSYITYEPLGYFLMIYNPSGNSFKVVSIVKVTTNGNVSYQNPSFTVTYASANYGKTLAVQIPGAYSPPQGLNDLQSWEGTVANSPDTNLDQLLDDIFDQSAAGTLYVTGEVTDTPELPQETPAPTAAPGDIIGGLDVISGQLESIDNSLTGVQEGVGEAVGQLEGISEGVGSISEALEVPTTSEAPTFKFDLTTLFPFCIPFDIYRFVTMFNASPVAPHVQIPFNIPAIGLQYTFDLDFSDFNTVASVLRSVELIAFCVGLAILTSKVIRW